MRIHKSQKFPVVALTFAYLINSATAEAKVKGPFIPATEWFTHDLKLGCINTNADRVPCPLTTDSNFRLYTAEDKSTALVIIEYLPDATGSADATAGAVVKLSPSTGKWELVKRAYNLGGQEPEQVKFTDKTVSMVLKTFRPKDGRCCPSGRKTVTLPTS